MYFVWIEYDTLKRPAPLFENTWINDRNENSFPET